MNIKDGGLLFFGDTYVCTTWVDGNTNESYMAVFRDLTDDGVVNFVMTQLAGPWVNRDGNSALLFDEYYKDLWWELYTRAEKVRDSLNREVPVIWEGEIQRH